MTQRRRLDYRERLLALPGDRDPLSVLAETPSRLEAIVRAHPVSRLTARAREGQWTATEVIGHLGDGEWVYGYRLRLILCEDEPPLVGTKQDAWVAAQRHNERDPRELVEIFRTLRGLNLVLWRRLSPRELARSGAHDERGRESLEVMLRMTAGHDLSHLAQIVRCLT